MVDATSFYTEYPFFKYHWYIAVEFFFILSGFLLASHAKRNQDETATKYLLGRIRRLYPEYIVAFAVMVILRTYTSGLNIVKVLIPNWLEMFMLQSVGTNIFPYINNPAWYVSALIIMSYLVYYMLKRNSDLFLKLIAPIAVILDFSYMYRKYGRLEIFYHTEGILGNTALLRAFMGIVVGVYAYELAQMINAREVTNKVKKYLLALVEVFIFAGILGFALLVEDGIYDFLFIPLFAIGIILASKDDVLGKIANIKPVLFLDKISYAIYLSHFFSIFVLNSVIKDAAKWSWLNLIIYYCIAVVIGFVLNRLGLLLGKLMDRVVKY